MSFKGHTIDNEVDLSVRNNKNKIKIKRTRKADTIAALECTGLFQI